MLHWLMTPERRRVVAEIEGTRERLYRMAFAWCHDAALADDLVQETLTRGIAMSAQLREAERLGGWLFAILHRCWLDHLRRRHEEVDDSILADLPADEPGPESHVERLQTAQRVRTAIAALPVGQRQVVTLVDLEELAYAEVADILAIPIGTVMSRLCRARAALRSALAPAVAERRLRSVK